MGKVFTESLRRNITQIFQWGGGLGALGFFVAIIVQNVDVVEGYADLLEAFPPAFLEAMGIGDVALIASPEGFIGFAFLTYGMILMAIYGIIAGMNITANEEDEGILDVELSLPIHRWQIIVEKYVASMVIVIGITILAVIGLTIGTMISPMEFELQSVYGATIGLIPLAWVVIAFTVFVGVLVRRKVVAIAIASTFVIASYVFKALGEVVTHVVTDILEAVSFFTYADGQQVIAEGFQVGNFILLIAASFVLLGASVWLFERRDIGL